MTTLKTYYADEIASALDAQLKDESFVGLYKKAQAPVAPSAAAQWWTKGPTAKAFKDKVDAAKTSQEIDVVVDTLNDPDTKTKLGQEGISDEAELQSYAYSKKMQDAKDGEPCAHDDDEMCPECADPGLAIAVDFAIRHVVKVADALDKAGYVGVAGALDETLRKLAAQRPAR